MPLFAPSHPAFAPGVGFPRSAGHLLGRWATPRLRRASVSLAVPDTSWAPLICVPGCWLSARCRSGGLRPDLSLSSSVVPDERSPL
jgi:hypothetical protein